MNDDLDQREQSSYDKKHRRIRGSLDYKYPPMVAACKTACGLGDDKGERGRDHRCVLAIGHNSNCEWSSECRGMDWRWRRGE